MTDQIILPGNFFAAPLAIDTILVPQGAEHRAVCQGLRRSLDPPTVFSVPVGAAPLTDCLEGLHRANLLDAGQRVLVMGLCGALSPDLAVGAGVLYRDCGYPTPNAGFPVPLACDRALTELIQIQLGDRVSLVQAVMSDRVISTVAEKQQLAQQTHADVVDMEGYAALDLLNKIGATVATLRVVSDDCLHDLPDLSHVFSPEGSLKPIALATAMLNRPIAAARLIRGSTQGLKILQSLTHRLFQVE